LVEAVAVYGFTVESGGEASPVFEFVKVVLDAVASVLANY